MSDSQPATEVAWAEQFQVTVTQVRDAIRIAGNDKAKVEMYLKGSHSSTDSDVGKAAGT